MIPKLSKTPPKWCESVRKLPRKCSGAASGEIACCHALATEAWDREPFAGDGNQGYIAFAYMFRRFGPSVWGYDDYKTMGNWYISTPMKGVFLSVYPQGGSIGCGYIVTDAVHKITCKPWEVWYAKFIKYANGKKTKHESLWTALEDDGLRKPFEKLHGKFPREPIMTKPGDWKKASPFVQRINRALLATMVELTRPTNVRDCYFNIHGRTKHDDPLDELAVEYHPLSGYGIPVAEMERLKKKDK